MGRASESAQRVLTRCVAAAQESGGARLSSLNALAAEAGVSHVTMLACVREFKRVGVLETRRGSGIFLAGRAAHPAPRMPLQWERTAQAIERAVRDGVYARGRELPSRKELCRRHGVCTTTLRKAVASLVEDQFLESDHRHLRIPRALAGGARSTVVAITVGSPQQAISLPTQRHGDDLRALEQAVTQAGLQTHLVFYWFRGQEQVTASGPEPAFTTGELDHITGFVLFTRGLLQATVTRILAALTPLRRPVAALDDSRAFAPGAALSRHPQLRVFSMASSMQCGQDMGRALLRLGHRHVAYVGPEATDWSERRFAGLHETVCAAGPPDTVTRWGIPSTAGSDAASPQSLAGRAAAALEKGTGDDRALARVLRGDAGRAVESVLTGQAQHVAYTQALRPAMDKILRAAPSAIVGGNDRIAWACVQVLRDRGVRVPEDVSVAGFDDTFEAFHNGLTSYNFNSAGAAQAALNHILSPTRGFARANSLRSQVHEVKGFVNVRATTRAV